MINAQSVSSHHTRCALMRVVGGTPCVQRSTANPSPVLWLRCLVVVGYCVEEAELAFVVCGKLACHCSPVEGAASVRVALSAMPAGQRARAAAWHTRHHHKLHLHLQLQLYGQPRLQEEKRQQRQRLQLQLH